MQEHRLIELEQCHFFLLSVTFLYAFGSNYVGPAPCCGRVDHAMRGAASVASLKFLFFSFFLKAKGPMNLSSQEPRSDDDTGESSPND